MADQAARDAALISGLKGLRSLSIMLPKFDGSMYVDDWLIDFDKYSVEMDRTSDANKLNDLLSHLSGEAMQWYRLQPSATHDNYADLRASFKERYSPSQQETFEVRGKIYSMKQGPLQKFVDFAREVQLKSRAINIPEEEIIGICIHGARPTIKSHLAMAKPDTMAALLKCPVVVSEPDNEDSITTMFQPMKTLVLMALRPLSTRYSMRRGNRRRLLCASLLEAHCQQHTGVQAAHASTRQRPGKPALGSPSGLPSAPLGHSLPRTSSQHHPSSVFKHDHLHGDHK